MIKTTKSNNMNPIHDKRPNKLNTSLQQTIMHMYRLYRPKFCHKANQTHHQTKPSSRSWRKIKTNCEGTNAEKTARIAFMKFPKRQFSSIQTNKKTRKTRRYKRTFKHVETIQTVFQTLFSRENILTLKNRHHSHQACWKEFRSHVSGVARVVAALGGYMILTMGLMFLGSTWWFIHTHNRFRNTAQHRYQWWSSRIWVHIVFIYIYHVIMVSRWYHVVCILYFVFLEYHSISGHCFGVAHHGVPFLDMARGHPSEQRT